MKPPVKMDLDYFIDFFEDMDDDSLTYTTDVASSYVAMSDAWGWLNTTEADALYEIIRPYGLLIHVNDGVGEYDNLGATVKERIVNFLKQIALMKSSVA